MWGCTHYGGLNRKLLVLNRDSFHCFPIRFVICPDSKSGLMTGLLDFAERWTRPLPTFLCSWITLVPGFHQAFPAQPSLTVSEPPSRALLWDQSTTLIQTPWENPGHRVLLHSNSEDTDAIAVLLLQFTLETINERNHPKWKLCEVQSVTKKKKSQWLFYMSSSAALFPVGGSKVERESNYNSKVFLQTEMLIQLLKDIPV